MEQINTSTNRFNNGNINQNVSHQNNAMNSDVEKIQLREMVSDFMNQTDINKRIRNMITSNGGKNNRFTVNVDELRQFNPRLAGFIVNDPLQAIKMFQDQLNNSAKTMREDGAMSKSGSSGNEKLAAGQDNFPKKQTIYYMNFEGNFGRNHVTPRGLRADLLNKYVQVSGIVTKMSIVKPVLQTSVHYCEETKRGHVFHYNDQNNLEHLANLQDDEYTGNNDQGNGFRTTDQNNNPLSAEYGYCIYRDQQVITLQEMPERAPTGQLPRSIQVILEDDLVDKVKPGDRVSITGIFRAKLGEQRMNAITTNQLIATGLQQLNYEKEKPNLTENDIKNIKKISKDAQLFDILGNSIASTIEGMSNCKKGLLLQLLGGAEKNLETGTHLRGDINILMVGDPSTAKSQLLRHVMDIAPLAINTTGRGSSGVGLTAAVTCDKDTGEKHLEAGAMVLADRGIVCIDEFDKMNDIDRVAIHEVMEQQTVTIAKAGIHVSLNARCSVVAAANPIYGEYARDQPVGRNIGMPDSLLSRFDLLFVILDEKDPDNDRKIAERVISNHRYQAPHNSNELASVFNYTNEDVVIENDFNEKKMNKEQNKDMIYEKSFIKDANALPTVTRDFLKKYLSYAKHQKAPELSQECIEYAAQLYSIIRNKALNYDQAKISTPITVRTLETMIRLATSHAKLRLSRTVDMDDINIAVGLLNESIFQETQKVNETEDDEKVYGEDDEDEEMIDENEDDEVIKRNKQSSRSQRYAQRNQSSNPSSPQKENQSKQSNQVTPASRKTRSSGIDAVEKATPQTASSAKKQTTQKKQLDPQQIDALLEGGRPSKRMKTSNNTDLSITVASDTHVTENESTLDVSHLFSSKKPLILTGQTQQPIQNISTTSTTGSSVATTVDMTQKRYLYKLITDNKGQNNQATINQLLKAFMCAPESETCKRGKPIIQGRAHMIQIVEELEKENLVMYSMEDGNVILI